MLLRQSRQVFQWLRLESSCGASARIEGVVRGKILVLEEARAYTERLATSLHHNAGQGVAAACLSHTLASFCAPSLA